uniref:Uncharacterized protein n=1 Tax=Glossina brevipalpis TaxID=37001 RepID=A0A1A9WZ61_9MUSC
MNEQANEASIYGYCVITKDHYKHRSMPKTEIGPSLTLTCLLCHNQRPLYSGTFNIPPVLKTCTCDIDRSIPKTEIGPSLILTCLLCHNQRPLYSGTLNTPPVLKTRTCDIDRSIPKTEIGP